MIEHLHLRNFKQFADQGFDLRERTVLAGPNNSGKTTLLQAIYVWQMALERWSAVTVEKEGQGPGEVPIARMQLLALPVRDLGLLWTDASTKALETAREASVPREAVITLRGTSQMSGEPWELAMEFRHENAELMWVKPAATDGLDAVREEVLYVPSTTGIELQEKSHAPEFQEWLIGQGKPGDFLRNLLVELHRLPPQWDRLVNDVKEIFGCVLLPPESLGRPFILNEYMHMRPASGLVEAPARLDISSAGSGFIQTLMLLAFLYARPASVILLDEPDAHLHVKLQRELQNRIMGLAGRTGSQVIIATHSEVLINTADYQDIVSLHGEPRRLGSGTERDRTREALKRVSSLDALGAGSGRALYVEGMSDYYFLRAWAKILGHPLRALLSDAQSLLVVPMGGRNPKGVRDHFFALQGVRPDIRGYAVVDKNNKASVPHSSDDNLKFGMWGRYEIENYLLNLDVIVRFAGQAAVEDPGMFAKSAAEAFRNSVTSDVLSDPFAENDITHYAPLSKGLLPRVLADARIRKNEFHRIAEVMKPEEIHPDIRRMLDRMWEHFESRGS